MKNKILSLMMAFALLISSFGVSGITANAATATFGGKTVQSYANYYVFNEYSSTSNNYVVTGSTIGKSVYVKKGVVVRLTNCTINGDLVVYGAAVLSGVTIYGKIYSSTFTSGYVPSTMSYGGVYMTGSNSYSGMSVGSYVSLGKVPYNIDECYYLGGKLYLKGFIADLIDVYVGSTKLTIAKDGMVNQSLSVSLTSDTVNLVFKDGNSNSNTISVPADERVYDSQGNINNLPRITASDCTVCLGDSDSVDFKASASDKEDGDVSKLIKCDLSKVVFTVKGTYNATLSVTDSQGATKTKTVKVTVADHSYVKNVKYSATCIDDGLAVYKCSKCGAAKYEAISKTSLHSWNSGVVVRIANCAHDGIRRYTCTTCGTIKTETIPMISYHTWDNGTVTKKGTCRSTGTMEYKCVICGEKRYETIPGTEHSPKKEIKPATTTKDGYVKTVCSLCGELINWDEDIKRINTVFLDGFDYDQLGTYTDQFYYTGKAKKPKITVEDEYWNVIPSKYYSVKITDNKLPGTAKITITFDGKRYKGTITKKFRIAIRPAVINALGHGSFKPDTYDVHWDKPPGKPDGYEVQAATDPNFKKNLKKIIIKNPKKTDVDISGRNPKKKQYFRLRAYKKINGKKYYSGWSEMN